MQDVNVIGTTLDCPDSDEHDWEQEPTDTESPPVAHFVCRHCTNRIRIHADTRLCCDSFQG